jgi:hypothetical protein
VLLTTGWVATEKNKEYKCKEENKTELTAVW